MNEEEIIKKLIELSIELERVIDSLESIYDEMVNIKEQIIFNDFKENQKR